jgi:hypothetical protein
MRTGLKSFLPDYGQLEIATQNMGVMAPGISTAPPTASTGRRFSRRRRRIDDDSLTPRFRGAVTADGRLRFGPSSSASPPSISPSVSISPRFGPSSAVSTPSFSTVVRASPRLVSRYPRYSPGSIPGQATQPAGSRILGLAPFPSGGYRVPTLRSVSSSASSPYLSSAYRRPQGQPSASGYWANTPGYMRAYSPAQSYMPAFSVQQYAPISRRGGGRRMGRTMRQLYRLLILAKKKGFRNWKVKSRRGRWVSRISLYPYPRKRSKLAKKIARTRRSLKRMGLKRNARQLVRRVIGKWQQPTAVSSVARNMGFRPPPGPGGFSGASWGDLGNVGMGPGMF